MPDYMPVLQTTQPISGVSASATITGGQLLESTGVNTVGPAGADSVKVVGVAASDYATGTDVTYHPISGNVHETTSPGGSAAGDRMVAAASGNIKTVAAATAAAAGTDLGVALNTATAGNKVRWLGR